MKKIILTATIILGGLGVFAPTQAKAAGSNGTVLTAVSSAPVFNVCLASAPALELTLSLTPERVWSNICLQNFDTAALAWLGNDVNGSTFTYSNSGNVGMVAVSAASSAILVNPPVCVPIVYGKPWYARGGKLSGCMNVSIYLER